MFDYTYDLHLVKSTSDFSLEKKNTNFFTYVITFILLILRHTQFSDFIFSIAKSTTHARIFCSHIYGAMEHTGTFCFVLFFFINIIYTILTKNAYVGKSSIGFTQAILFRFTSF